MDAKTGLIMNKQSSYFLSLMLFSIALSAETFTSEKHNFTIETVVEGLEHPWSVDFLPDGRFLVTEKPGRLRIVSNGQLSDPVSGLPKIKEKGQGGLLDIALDPDYANNQIIYLSYSAKGKGGVGTEVVKGKLVGNELKDAQVIFKLTPKTSKGQHFGSRLLFAKDSSLFITLGDRGDKDRAQDLNDHAGSLIHINKDGSIPEDNPFVNNPNAKPEIYTYGNRNMQGIAMHPETGDIWTIEHGPQGGDELNLMKAGVNYGWPVITYGVNYVIGTKIGEGTEKEGMAQPIHYWVPSIATSSLLFYTGDKFPNWKGNAFVSSLKFGQLARLEIQDNKVIKEERLINGKVGRIREVQQGLDGYIYMITDESNGRLLRIKPLE
ncbi:MAG: PQQ-dependent sugar dehydrogenase [Proteobacteria bacterium]|nr:PQQ-dependent sugar dehydrogenase [Pseudomonadota bacterium]NOG59289.1 PQQ-dependent sugar dehydrogenase [Pseudomonadota bacterium]